VSEEVPFGVQEFHDATLIHPVGLAMVVLMGIAVLVLERRWAVIPFLIIACFVASAQRISPFGLDVTLLRIMVTFGAVRALVRGEFDNFKPVPLDGAVLVWSVVATAIYVIQQGTVGALIQRLGYAYDALGLYFIFRMLVRDWRDYVTIGVALAAISIPVMLSFVAENRTSRNLFSFFGGVPTYTVEREGRLRCQGAFSHSIHAGVFFAAALPLIVSLWWTGQPRRTWAVVGAFASTVAIGLTASSTPVAAFGLVLVGYAMFPLRRYLGWICLGIVMMLVALHFAMKKPVWHLMARIELVGGSTGWHRYNLIDEAVNRWTEWALLGTPSTVHWGIVDITNEYILHAIRGGLATMLAFIAIIVLAFSHLVFAVRTYERDRRKLMISWSLGVSMFVHSVVFLTVSYFGQIIMLWYLHLAMIGSLRVLGRTESLRARAIRARRARGARRRDSGAQAPNPIAGAVNPPPRREP